MSKELDEETRALGTLLAGEVDGSVDELARYIMASAWMFRHDLRIREEQQRRDIALYVAAMREAEIDAARAVTDYDLPEEG